MDTFYAIGGVGIRARCEDPAVAELVDARLRPLRHDEIELPDVRVEIRGPGASRAWPPEPIGPGRTVFEPPNGVLEYFDHSDQLFLDYEDRVRLRCTPCQGRIDLAITGTDPDDASLAAFSILTVALVETMKRFGQFSLHAAALALNGKGVLVAGSSGAGKSTMTVNLVRSGFDFLSDDTIFLSSSSNGVWVSGLPDEIDVTNRTVSMFGELRFLADRPLRPGRDKHAVRVEDVFDVLPLAGCHPVALLSPRVEEGSSPRLEELAPSKALLELMPNILATDPTATQAHLDVLADLVRTVPCYSFRYGSDLDAAARCITDLVS
jgi:HPr Serine kinase C-terminal domain